VRLIERRIGLLFAAFLLCFLVIVVRAFWLQGVQGSSLASQALNQQTETVVIPGLRGALLDSGLPCPRVEKATIQGPWKNMMMWRAKCAGDPRYDYAVFVGPDASIQARYCAEMKDLKLPVCRPFSSNPPAAIRLPAAKASGR